MSADTPDTPPTLDVAFLLDLLTDYAEMKRHAEQNQSARQIEALASALPRLLASQEDAARLDWLERTGTSGRLREAIDAARASRSVSETPTAETATSPERGARVDEDSITVSREKLESTLYHLIERAWPKHLKTFADRQPVAAALISEMRGFKVTIGRAANG
jgi:hypothetical protein